MNPFLSRRFLFLSLVFALILVFTFVVFVRDSTVDWQRKNYNENSAPIGSYDFATTFPAENGMLIVAQKSGRSNYYYSSYNTYMPSSEYDNQILFADNQGVHFITYSDQSFYNAVCERKQCLMMFSDGYQTVNLTDFSVSEFTPWSKKPGELFSTLIMGKIYQSKNAPVYVAADNQNIFTSADKGVTWKHFINVRDLAKSLFPEEIEGNSNFAYATYRDKIVMWYSYGNQMGSLEVILDIPTKKIISSKWLPVRINEAVQNLKGDIFVIAQEPSRRLFSLMQFHTNGNFELVAESGYNNLHSLNVGSQGLIVSSSGNGSQQYLMMDFATKEIRYRPELPLYNKIFNGENQSFIEIEGTYSNERDLIRGAQISYQSAF